MSFQSRRAVTKWEHHAGWLLKKIGAGPIAGKRPSTTRFRGIIENVSSPKTAERLGIPPTDYVLKQEDFLVKRQRRLNVAPPNDPFLSSFSLSAEEMQAVARQCGRLVAFLNKNNIMLGDIHPDNFFIQKTNGRIKVRLLDLESAAPHGKPHFLVKTYRNPPVRVEHRFFIDADVPTHMGAASKERDRLKLSALEELPHKEMLEGYDEEMRAPWYSFKGRRVLNPKKPQPTYRPRQQ